MLVISLNILIAALASNPIAPSVHIEDPRGFLRAFVFLVGTLAANDIISLVVTAVPKNSLLVLTCGLVWRLANPNRIKPFSCAEYFHYIPKYAQSVVLDHNMDFTLLKIKNSQF